MVLVEVVVGNGVGSCCNKGGGSSCTGWLAVTGCTVYTVCSAQWAVAILAQGSFALVFHSCNGSLSSQIYVQSIGDTSPEFTCKPGYSTNVDHFKGVHTTLSFCVMPYTVS